MGFLRSKGMAKWGNLNHWSTDFFSFLVPKMVIFVEWFLSLPHKRESAGQKFIKVPKMEGTSENLYKLYGCIRLMQGKSYPENKIADK